MAYVSDITIPDGSPISGGSSFTKTWRLKNTGNCPWTTNFMFTFVSGAQMGGMNRYLPYQVNPGETIDLSIDLIAPTTPGTYQGYWQIKTPTGFGVGFAIWVQIVVPGAYWEPTATPYIIYVSEPTATPDSPSSVSIGHIYQSPTPTPTSQFIVVGVGDVSIRGLRLTQMAETAEAKSQMETAIASEFLNKHKIKP